MNHPVILAIAMSASTACGQDKAALLLIGNKAEGTLSFVDARTLKELAKTSEIASYGVRANCGNSLSRSTSSACHGWACFTTSRRSATS